MTSMPTKKRPSRRRWGRRRSTIWRSAASRAGAGGGAADVEVGARLALRGDAQQGGQRLAVDAAGCACRPVAHFRHVALRHRPARPEAGHLLQDREEVAIVVAQVEDALAALAAERLDDHLAAQLGEEVDELGDAARDPRLRHEIGKLDRVELLVGPDHRVGAVQHERAAAQRQDLGGGDVVGVDRGVLALEHHVAVVVERERSRRAEVRVAAHFAAQHDRLGAQRRACPPRPRDRPARSRRPDVRAPARRASGRRWCPCRCRWTRSGPSRRAWREACRASCSVTPGRARGRPSVAQALWRRLRRLACDPATRLRFFMRGSSR